MRKKFKYALLSLFIALLASLSGAVIACAPEEPNPVTDGSELGVYYSDVGNEEYLITLLEGNGFAFVAGADSKSGAYRLDGENLTLTFADGGELNATYKDEQITLTYNGAVMTFIKKVNYTVSFDSLGGSAVVEVTVVNGKRLTKPLSPTRDKYVFAGWYTDRACTLAYDFTKPVTEDMTLYARWVQSGEEEFTINFDLMYSSDNPARLQTAGGKLYNLPEPEREGYTFGGWWVSMLHDGAKLSYRVTEDVVFCENMTVYALWLAAESGARLPAPVVNVSQTMISWNGVTGASTYRLLITDPDGGKVTEENVGGTSKAFDFSSYSEGDYVISVTAVSSNTEKNSATTVRYWRNKGLARVSLFNVEGTLFKFNAVANAADYLLTVECGDSSHNHTDLSLEGKTEYDFKACPMKPGGIVFTVKAVAEGFVPSEASFKLERVLDAVEGFTLDPDTLVLSWTAVPNATGYRVSVNDGEFESISTNSISLKQYDAGTLTVKVIPTSYSYNSPEASVYTFEKTGLATPMNIRIVGYILMWNEVTDAEKYEVKIGDSDPVEVRGATEYDLEGKVDFANDSLTLTVRAVGAGGVSLWSDPMKLTTSLEGTLTYSANTLSWQAVPGVTTYEVRVNSGEARQITDGSNSAAVKPDHSGANLLEVRFLIGEVWSEWAGIEVEAFIVTFETYGGTGVAPQFGAAGDTVVLDGVPERAGYDFVGWYDTAEDNGVRYGESFTVSGDTTVYAHYSPKQYTVTLMNGSSVFATESVTFQNMFRLSVPEKADDTLSFVGWFTMADGLGTQYTDSNGNSLQRYTVADNVTLYAFWRSELLKFTLTTLPGTNKQVYSVTMGNFFLTASLDAVKKVKLLEIPAVYQGVPVGIVAANAFNTCYYLEEIKIPDSVVLISSSTPFPVHEFQAGDHIAAITIYHVENNNEIRYFSDDGVLYDYGPIDDQPADRNLIVPTLLYVPVGKTGEYKVKDGVETIPSYMFERSNLNKIIIPASVTRVAMYAFSYCYASEIEFLDPEQGQAKSLAIEFRAFFNGQELTTIKLPARVSSMDLSTYALGRSSGTPASQPVNNGAETVGNIFRMCSDLTEVTIGTNNKGTYYSIEDGIIYNANKTELLYALPYTEGEYGVVSIPVGVTKIMPGAFIGASDIGEVVIPFTVQDIGEAAFYATYISKVTFGGNAQAEAVTIGKYAFRECSWLSELEFAPDSLVRTIGEGAFYKCSRIATLAPSSTLTLIENQAFRECAGLSEVTFADGVMDIVFMDDIFYGCSNLTTINLPKNATRLPGFGGLSSIENINIAQGNEHFSSFDGIIYNSEQTELLFYPKAKEGSFDIPASVTRIGGGAFQNTAVTSVKIGKNITEIGNSAFAGCASLTSLTFETDGTSPLKIGDSAFEGCSGLVTIALPVRTQSVGNNSFASLDSLTTLTLNEGLQSAGEYAFSDNGSLRELTLPASLTTIGDYLFYNCTKLNNITFTGGYKYAEIPVGMFAATAITSFTLPAAVTAIGEDAFYSCERLTTFTVPDGSALESIGGAAFYGSAITSFKVPASVTSIGEYAFAETKLESMVFEKGAGDLPLEIGEESFRKNENLKSIELPARLQFIPEYTFYGCSALAQVTFEKDSALKYIGENAFERCGLVSITIPKSVGDSGPDMAIGTEAFAECENLQEFICESGNTHTFTLYDDDYASYSPFYGCDKLKTLVLPEGLRYWPYGIPDSLESVTINDEPDFEGKFASYDGVLYSGDYSELVFVPVSKTGALLIHADAKTISSTAFEDCEGITSVTLPSAWTEFNRGWFADLVSLEDIFVAAPPEGFGAGLYTDGQGAIYSGDKTAIYYYPIKSEASDFVLPAEVTSIMESAFEGALNLKRVTFAKSESDLSIGDRAFANTGLTSFEFPVNLVSLGNMVFEGCEQLTAITAAAGCKLQTILPRALENITGLVSLEIPENIVSIPDAVPVSAGWSTYYYGLIYGCDNLESIVFKGTKLESIGMASFYTSEYRNTIAGSSASFYPSNSKINSITLPSSLKTIGEAAFAGAQITSLQLPAGLKTIAGRAFSQCAKLLDINIPESVTAIGQEAFANCSGALRIVINGAVTEIGKEAFTRNSSVQTVSIGAGTPAIGEWMFFGCSSLIKVTIPVTITSIGESAFRSCSQLTEIDIPEGVASIGNYAFASSGLKTVTIPGTATNLGTYLFQNCASLDSVTLPAKLSAITDYMFDGCEKLAALDIPQSVTTISRYAFRGCTGMSEFKLPAAVQTIGAYAFAGCTGIESFTLPDNVTQLGESVFEGCENLAGLNFPAGLESLGDYALSGTGFTTITIPETVKSLGDGLFEDCEKLTEVTITGAGTSLGSGMFGGCKVLESINLPAGLTTIAEGLFDGFATLKEFTIPASVTSIGAYAFRNTAITQLTIPAGVTEIGAYAFSGTGLKEIVIPEQATKLGDYLFYNCKSLASVTINSQITAIGNYMFAGTSSLAIDFVVPSTVQTIGDFAFSESGITGVTIPESVTSLSTASRANKTTTGHNFYNAPSLATVTFAANCKITELPYYVFAECPKLQTVEIPSTVQKICGYTFQNSGITSATIPGSYGANGSGYGEGYVFDGCTDLQTVVFAENVNLETIASDFFRNCSSLTSVTLPNSITTIYSEAFLGCSKLERINIPASVRTLGTSAFKQTGLTEVTLPAALTAVNSNVFQGCEKLATVNVQKDVASIGAYAFEGCTALKGIQLPANLGYISYCAFANSGLQSITIPEEVVYLGRNKTTSSSEGGVFSGCTDLTEVVFAGDKIVSLSGSGTFKGCTKITSITIPASIVYMGANTFEGWTDQQTINIAGKTENDLPSGWNANWYANSQAKLVWNYQA